MTPFLLPALTATGHIAEAYLVLLNDSCPGWLYEVARGATTTWERWDAIRQDGSINTGDLAHGDTMSSFNHYAYGSVGAWLYRSVAGISPAAAGYRRVRFAPSPGGGVSWARGSVQPPYGRAAVAWSLRTDRLEVYVEVPPGAEGELISPDGWSGDSTRVLSGTHTFVLEPAL